MYRKLGRLDKNRPEKGEPCRTEEGGTNREKQAKYDGGHNGERDPKGTTVVGAQHSTKRRSRPSSLAKLAKKAVSSTYRSMRGDGSGGAGRS